MDTFEYPAEVVHEAMHHRQNMARYCHGIENQLSFALNVDEMTEIIEKGWNGDPRSLAGEIATAIRLRGPFAA